MKRLLGEVNVVVYIALVASLVAFGMACAALGCAAVALTHI